mgnify:CR=1 FL=1
MFYSSTTVLKTYCGTVDYRREKSTWHLAAACLFFVRYVRTWYVRTPYRTTTPHVMRKDCAEYCTRGNKFKEVTNVRWMMMMTA